VERAVKLRVKVDYKTYQKLKEEEEYRDVLEDAINYGLTNKTTSFTRIRAGVYKTEREKHKDLQREGLRYVKPRPSGRGRRSDAERMRNGLEAEPKLFSCSRTSYQN
jgi:putative transposase